jgi:hypothetical protein
MSKGLFDRLEQELEARQKAAGLSMADLLELPESLRALVNWMMRQQTVSLAQAAAHLGQDETAGGATLATLIDKGFVRELKLHGETCYRVRLAPKRKRDVPLDVWRALDDKLEE